MLFSISLILSVMVLCIVHVQFPALKQCLPPTVLSWSCQSNSNLSTVFLKMITVNLSLHNFQLPRFTLTFFILFEAVWVAMELYLILPAFLLLTTLSSSITAWRPLVRSQERALPEDILHEMTLNVVRHLIILTLLF